MSGDEESFIAMGSFTATDILRDAAEFLCIISITRLGSLFRHFYEAE